MAGQRGLRPLPPVLMEEGYHRHLLGPLRTGGAASGCRKEPAGRLVESGGQCNGTAGELRAAEENFFKKVTFLRSFYRPVSQSIWTVLTERHRVACTQVLYFSRFWRLNVQRQGAGDLESREASWLMWSIPLSLHRVLTWWKELSLGLPLLYVLGAKSQKEKRKSKKLKTYLKT